MSEAKNSSPRGRDLYDFLHGNIPKRDDRLYRLPLPASLEENEAEEVFSALDSRVHIVGSAVVHEATGTSVVFEVKRRQSEERMRRLARLGFEGLSLAIH